MKSPIAVSNITIGGIPVVIAEWAHPNEIFIIVPEQRTTITYHEGPEAGTTKDVVIREQKIYRMVNIEPPDGP